jgi:poly-gamma-glutamate capsule biosynthesis protein CapA/YwtB (metallophosphatase superfamily)
MKKLSCLLVPMFFMLVAHGQTAPGKDSLSLMFIGDIMGHGAQISSAYDSSSGRYHYESVFSKISGLFNSVDFAIANLEVTLAGKPYTGYPQFSSPDALAAAVRKSGVKFLVTANNHSCDRGKAGIRRTLDVLDSLGFRHTGTFRDLNDRDTANLLVIEKNHIRVGLLNYTYGTNGIPVPSPAIVNLIDTNLIAADIEKSRCRNLDKLVVMIHWGNEYESSPNANQERIKRFLLRHGVDIIIGSHPHVLQRMEYHEGNRDREYFIAYSLGNFVSNQLNRRSDGGAVVKMTITKSAGRSFISDAGYTLVWVNKPVAGRGTGFEVISCRDYEDDQNNHLDANSRNKMKIFLDDSRGLLQKENIHVEETR